MIYAIAMFSYLLMCIFSLGSFLFIDEALKNTPAGRIDARAVFVTVTYMLNTGLLFAGVMLSAKRKLTPKAAGYIMSMPYFILAAEFLFTFIHMMLQNNGHMSLGAWTADFAVPIICALCVMLYFTTDKTKFSYIVIIFTCLVSVFDILYGYTLRLTRITDLGFAVSTVHCIGRLGMAALLGYQAYVLEMKKRLASAISC